MLLMGPVWWYLHTGPWHHPDHDTILTMTSFWPGYHPDHHTILTMTPPWSQHHSDHDTILTTIPSWPHHHHDHDHILTMTPPWPWPHPDHDPILILTLPWPWHHPDHDPTLTMTPPWPWPHADHDPTLTMTSSWSCSNLHPTLEITSDQFEQTHCAHVSSDSKWVTELFVTLSFWLNIHRSGVLTVLFGCYMAGTTWNCHLRFWQNDWDLLHAIVVTWWWSGSWKKGQHRMLTLEKKILLPRLGPKTFWSQGQRSTTSPLPKLPIKSIFQCSLEMEGLWPTESPETDDESDWPSGTSITAPVVGQLIGIKVVWPDLGWPCLNLFPAQNNNNASIFYKLYSPLCKLSKLI